MAHAWSYIRQLESGRLEFRRAFPKEVRAFVRRRELIVSLGAHSLDSPGVVERYRAASEDYDRLLCLAGKASAGTFDELDGPTSAFLAEWFFVQQLELDDERRWATGEDREDRWAFKTAETLDGILPLYRQLQAKGDVPGLLDVWTEEAGYVAEAHGLRFHEGTESFSLFCRALNEAAIRAGEIMLQRLRGELAPTPTQPVKGPMRPESLLAGAALDASTFAELVEEALQRPSFSAGHSTKEAVRTALRSLTELHGQLTTEKITRAHVSQLIDALTLCPVVRGKERARSLPDLIKRHADSDLPRLSLKTIQTHIGALQSVWNKIQSAGHIAQDRANPFAGHKRGREPIKRQRRDLTRDEAAAIFALPLFTRGERPARGKAEACFWVPLILAATGARPEEVAQLLVGDIQFKDADQEWTLTITDEGIHPHKGARRLKTENGQRTFPIPTVLLELGLLDYVAWLRSRGEVALFPSLRTKGKRKLLFAGFSEWWGSYLREHGVYPQGKRGGRDFRHTWATIARECGVRQDAQEYIMGHTPAGGMNARYGSRESLSREMRKMAFDGWGFALVRPWQAPSNEPAENRTTAHDGAT